MEGAQAKFQMINMERATENQQILLRLGTKQFQSISKDAAMKAMAVTFQKLDIIVESSDYQGGLLAGRTKGVKPLSYEEFEVVKSIEKVRMEKHFGFSSFGDPSRIELVYNAVVLETADGVQISLRGRSDIKTGAAEVTSAEFPPKWLEISYTKIWNEFEKNIFVQAKTLK
jgi:hypothetical protein